MKMKTHLKKILTLASISMLGLFDCTGGTGEGNPEFGVVSVSLSARTGLAVVKASADLQSQVVAKAAANDTLMVFDAGKTPFSIHNIYAHFDQVEIERPKGEACRSTDSVVCTDSSAIVSVHRYIDLLANPSPLILNEFPLPPGLYSRMKVRFRTLSGEGAGSIPTEYLPLVGHSIMMKGTFSYNGVPNRALVIYLDIDETFKFENPAGLALTTNLPFNWTGVFLAGRWLNELEITKCLDENQIALEPDGSLVIDSGTGCNDLKESLIENVRSSTSFEEEDEEDDGDDLED